MHRGLDAAVLIWTFLFSAVGWAASVDVYVHGIDGARAVEVVADAGSGWSSVSCQDQGTGPDDAVDGSWTCAGLQVVGGAGRLAVVADAVSFQPIEVDFSARTIHVATQRRRLVPVDPDDVTPVPAAVPSGPGMILLAQLVMDADARVPVVVIRNGYGSTELFCRDDGRGLDRRSNDAEYMCYGWLPGPLADASLETEAILRETMGTERSLGFMSHTSGAGLRFVRLDAVGGSPPVTTPQELSLRQAGPDQPTPPKMVHAEVTPPPSVSVTPAPPGEDSPVTPTPPPVMPTPPGEEDQPTTFSAAPNDLSSVVTVCALVFGGLVGWRMRSVSRGTPSLPGQLEAVASSVSQGPGLEDPVAIRCSVPDAALAQLVTLWAQYRRVVVVATQSVPPAPGVLRLRSDDVHDLQEAVGVLQGQRGSPVALVIHGRQTLRDHATPSPDPLVDLLRGLGQRVPVAVVLKEGEEGPEGVVLWDYSEEKGWVRVT